MASGFNVPDSINGRIPKNTECEFSSHCSDAGVRCGHDAFGSDATYTCGYCKSFRMIEYLRKQNEEEQT